MIHRHAAQGHICTSRTWARRAATSIQFGELYRIDDRNVLSLVLFRLDASKYKPSKSQRNTLNRFNTLVRLGGAVPNAGPSSQVSIGQSNIALVGGQAQDKVDRKGKGKAKAGTFDLQDVVHAAEYQNAHVAAHRLTVSLEPAKFSQERYALYKRYQIAVHGDTESKLTEKGFTRFLCDSPLRVSAFLC